MTVSLKALLGEEPTFRRGLVDGLRLTVFAVLTELVASIVFGATFATLVVLWFGGDLGVAVSGQVRSALDVVLIGDWIDYAIHFDANLGYLAWLLVAYGVGAVVAYELVYRTGPRVLARLRRR